LYFALIFDVLFGKLYIYLLFVIMNYHFIIDYVILLVNLKLIEIYTCQDGK